MSGLQRIRLSALFAISATILVATAFAFAPAVSQQATAQTQRTIPPRTVDDFFQDITAQWVLNNPNIARATRFFKGDVQDRLERQLTPLTLAYSQAQIERAKQGLANLKTYDRAAMFPTQRVSAEVLEQQLQAYVDGERFLDYYFPLEQFGGANIFLVNALVIVHPLKTERDADNYVVALGQVRTRMQEAIAESGRLAAKRFLPPRFILNATIAQMQRFIATPAAQNPYVTTLMQKTTSFLSDAKRESLRAQAERIVDTEVYPAWREAIAVLQSQVPQANDDAGLWRLPNGAAAYAFYLKLYTTTNMTPDEIHELGLKQVEVIDAQMDQVLRRLGRTQGSIKERIEKLRQERGYPNPASEQSRAAIMMDIEGILRDAERRAALLFDNTPRAAVIAEPFPSFSEANGQANYTEPPADGSRPGIFQYPRRVEKMTKFDLRTTVYHETVPGHHFQIAMQLENKDLPAFRQQLIIGGNSSFIEGWGLYAEHLAAESGWYDNDLEGLLGQLFWEEFRARRLVVDTGLHAKHWTRQQAIDYGIEPAEVERYVVMPGQATSYMVGELKILEQREKARRALGNRFSLKDFHNMVLGIGSVPLDMLERETDAFIARGGKAN